jgi:hypothetical protein
MMLALDTRFAQIPNESSPSRASVSLSFDRTYLAECEGAMADLAARRSRLHRDVSPDGRARKLCRHVICANAVRHARIHNMILSFSVAALFSGIGIGFMVAAPIGPMGILCIQRTLASGIATGLATGLGAATVHLAYSAVAVIGLGVIVQPWIDAHTVALSVLSGVIMLAFAIRANRGSIVLQESVQSSRIHLSPHILARSPLPSPTR